MKIISGILSFISFKYHLMFTYLMIFKYLMINCIPANATEIETSYHDIYKQESMKSSDSNKNNKDLYYQLNTTWFPDFNKKDALTRIINPEDFKTAICDSANINPTSSSTCLSLLISSPASANFSTFLTVSSIASSSSNSYGITSTSPITCDSKTKPGMRLIGAYNFGTYTKLYHGSPNYIETKNHLPSRDLNWFSPRPHWPIYWARKKASDMNRSAALNARRKKMSVESIFAGFLYEYKAIPNKTSIEKIMMDCGSPTKETVSIFNKQYCPEIINNIDLQSCFQYKLKSDNSINGFYEPNQEEQLGLTGKAAENHLVHNRTFLVLENYLLMIPSEYQDKKQVFQFISGYANKYPEIKTYFNKMIKEL